MIVIFAAEEAGLAVLEREDGTTFTVKREQLPPGAKPGDSLAVIKHNLYELAPEETAKRKQRVQKLLEDLWEK